MNHLSIFFGSPVKRWFIACALGLVFIVVALISTANDDQDDHTTPATAAQDKTAEHDEKAIELSDAQLKNAGIGLARVDKAIIKETIALYGTIESNGERIQQVTARFPGVIKTVNTRLGESVRQGDVLATIEGDESLRTYSVTAAISGVVAQRNGNPGEHTTDKPLFVIADLSTVWVDVAIFPRDFAKIRVGQSVRVVNPANNEQAEGEIVVVNLLGANKQTISARVLLENQERHWAPGLFVNAHVTLASSPVTLAIRNEAMQEHEGKTVVFVRAKAGFEPRPVTLGRTDGELSEVVSGIVAGETYATKNSFIIKAELGKDGAEHGH